MALNLPEPHVGQPTDKDLLSLTPAQFKEAVKERMDQIQRNFERLAAQYPAGIGKDTYQHIKPHILCWNDGFAQNLVTVTDTQIIFDNAVDIHGAGIPAQADIANNRVVIQVPGLYYVSAQVIFLHNSAFNINGAHRLCRLFKNGSLYRDQGPLHGNNTQAGNGVWVRTEVSAQMRLDAGDIITLAAYHDCGASPIPLLIASAAGITTPFLEMRWISP